MNVLITDDQLAQKVLALHKATSGLTVMIPNSLVENQQKSPASMLHGAFCVT